MPSGLYLHLPFCRVHCPYCSFNVYAGLEATIPTYIDALPMELALRLEDLADRAPSRIDTIYLGGGTPSLLSPDQVAELLDAVWKQVSPGPATEVTNEVDPGTADRARLLRRSSAT